MIKPVVAYPSQLLRTKTFEVNEISDEVKQFCKDLSETMEIATGAGIAAPQIGALARIFVISKNVSKTEDHVVFINPVIESISKEKQTFKEGCLSFYGVFFDVKRAKEVTVSYTDLNGTRQTITATGFYAQAIQHEYEHLDGKLFIDHAGTVRRELARKKMKKLLGGFDGRTKYLDYRTCLPNSDDSSDSLENMSTTS